MRLSSGTPSSDAVVSRPSSSGTGRVWTLCQRRVGGVSWLLIEEVMKLDRRRLFLVGYVHWYALTIVLLTHPLREAGEPVFLNRYPDREARIHLDSSPECWETSVRENHHCAPLTVIPNCRLLVVSSHRGHVRRLPSYRRRPRLPSFVPLYFLRFVPSSAVGVSLHPVSFHHPPSQQQVLHLIDQVSARWWRRHPFL